MDLLVSNWRRDVADEDTVVHLGDVGFGPKPALVDLFNSLPGDRVLVRGNHDSGTKRFLEMGFDKVLTGPAVHFIQDSDMGFVQIVSVEDSSDFFGTDEEANHVVYVSHRPVTMPVPDRDPWGVYLYGHIHDRDGLDPYYPYPWGRNVGVEVSRCRLNTLKELIDDDTYKP
jgi:calcineurin-like phosphoesterase family protein